MNIKIGAIDCFDGNAVHGGLLPMFICLQEGGDCYPADDWVDNAEVVVGWWTQSVIDLIKGGEGQGICFMEGGYDIDLKYKSEVFYLDSEDGEISWIVSKEGVINALVGAYEKLIEIYKKIGVDNPVGFYKSIELLKSQL
ncbi:hypothetical protein HCH_02074 [Hahella chejuensis KCTC 2396]|uniref:Uncharacterized protein n=1 Tax=Hahella chejuensis (strain KCTC 2396) TaxID=349521 RepID=Q2SKB9_HAHCH|nr:hypothetical protein [Hahella chejuensis]ABC28905.1 hypothetical protein HCH_02074 [Hahella chejuensis KCTC 2396]